MSRAISAGDGDAAATLDVPADSTSVLIELVARGAAVTFSAPALSSELTPTRETRALTPDEQARLRALANVIGYLRFFSPSDEAAKLDWIAVEVEATRRMLAARDDREARAVLAWLLAAAAPKAALYDSAKAPTIALDQAVASQWLTRWVRVGLGPDAPYLAFRDGISEPPGVGVGIYKLAEGHDIDGCKHVVATAHVHIVDGAPKPELVILPLRGYDAPGFVSTPIGDTARAEADVAEGVAAIGFGLKVGGHGTLDLRDITLSCKDKPIAKMVAGDKLIVQGGGQHLYSITESAAADGDSLRISRPTETTFDPQRDVLDADIGLGLRLRMPLVAWTDGKRTFPDATAVTLDASWTPRDLPARVAMALDTWVVLRWFYPYFDDLGIRWDGELAPALDEVARASTDDDALAAIAHITAALRDDHASVGKRDFIDGVLPLFFRKLGDELIFVAGIDAYRDVLPRGAQIESIDGVATTTALARRVARVSAATDGWRDYETTFALGYGHRGELMELRAREPGGRVRDVAIPRVDMKEIDKLHEERPESGTEPAPGVVYINLDGLTASAWDALIPKVQRARVLIFDLRGYMTNVAFDVLSHFADGEMKSPFWDSPVIDPAGARTYERLQWSIFPRARFSAKAIFLADGRTASAAETVLQFVRAYKLGVIVGEQTGGTNGNTATFETVGGLRVRFTAMRVLNQDGSVLHGHGIPPHVTVHPTPDGIVAGRDEILEAAIKAASSP